MKSVNLVADHLLSDSEIERAAIEVLRARMPMQQDPIRVTVENGQVSLEGFVSWHHQKAVAEEAVRELPGVTGVVNRISPKPQVLGSVIKAQIDNAFAHRGRLGARAISVEAANSEVILKGSVRTLEEKELAEATARATAGVAEVTSALIVESAATD
jgi:osmotically-inducible protein OsmY